MESISRISSILETARDLTLEAARDVGSARKTAAATRALPATQLKKLIDSRNDREVLEGLRKVISMTYRGQDSLQYFTSVIKNIASPSLEIKKLVYIYLVHHAEAAPDTALLSINTIQKALSDSNPQLRALALRVMSSIRVPVISQIVLLGIKRGIGDMSPYVRKAAALAIPKCYRLDPGSLPQLLEHLSVLLGDRQYYVAGAAVAAFLDTCPDRLDLVHRHYRSLVRKLVDMDEWGQLATLRLMIVYGRKCFPRRTKLIPKTATLEQGNAKKTIKGFYEDDEKESLEQRDADEMEEVIILDPDLELLLNAAKPLLQSRNPAVIVGVAACYLYLGTTTYLDSAIGPLISLLRGPQDIQHIALHNIVQVCLVRPQAFVKHVTHFLVRSTDPAHIWRLKLEALTLIFPHSEAHLKGLILSELEHFSRGRDFVLVRESVRAIGRCAQSDVRNANRCMRLLLKQVGSSDAHLVAEALEVIRHLIQQAPQAHIKTVIRLAKTLDTMTSPQARACIIWLVGEFAGIQPQNNIAADVLRILAKGFADETEVAKLQIVLLAAKVYVHHLNMTNQGREESLDHQAAEPSRQHPESITDQSLQDGGQPADETNHPIAVLWRYILLLARYDTSYDLRDRARVYRAVLAVPSSTELASLLLLAPKPVPQTPSPSEKMKAFNLGSASLIVADAELGGLRGYEPVPEWVQDGIEPDPRLREEDTSRTDYGDRKPIPAAEKLDTALETGASAMTAKKVEPFLEKSLDDWLAEGEEHTGDKLNVDNDDGEEEGDESEYETESETEESSEDEYTDEESEGDVVNHEAK